MADAYARATRKPAIVQLHSYAGLANGLGMMYYAKRGYAPLKVIAGEAGLRYEAMDGQMSADLISMARPFVKSDYNGPCAWRVVHSGSLLRLLRRAIKSASTPPMGPVFLALPMDILEETNTEPIIPSIAIDTQVSPDPAVITKAAQLLINAERPLFLIGDGISASCAQEELSTLAKILKADIYGVNNSEVNILSTNPNYKGDTEHMFGTDSQAITSTADVVLISGTTVMPEVFPLLEGVFADGAKIIQFDLNTYEIAKNFPVTIACMADPKLALGALFTEVQKFGTAVSTVIEENSSELNENNNTSKIDNVSANAHISNQLLLTKFTLALKHKLKKEEVVLFDEALTNSAEIFRILSREYENSYYQTRAGMLGTGLPGTIGLKIAYPEKTVVGFIGDGGAISTIQALNIASRYSIEAKFIVCNNRSYRILKYNIERYRQDLHLNASALFPTEFDLTGLDFVKLAEGQGVKGEKVERQEDIVFKRLKRKKPCLNS